MLINVFSFARLGAEIESCHYSANDKFQNLTWPSDSLSFPAFFFLKKKLGTILNSVTILWNAVLRFLDNLFYHLLFANSLVLKFPSDNYCISLECLYILKYLLELFLHCLQFTTAQFKTTVFVFSACPIYMFILLFDFNTFWFAINI